MIKINELNRIAIGLIIGFAWLFHYSLISQHYEFAGGMRYDERFGITFSQRVYKTISLEQNLLAENEYSNYSFFLFVRNHQPLITSRFNWYYGGGLGLIRLKETVDLLPKSTPAISLQTGIEFSIKRLVLAAGVEPVFYSGREDFKFNMNAAISAKYAFIPKKKPRKPTFKERIFGKSGDKRKDAKKQSDKKKSSTKISKKATEVSKAESDEEKNWWEFWKKKR